MGMFKAPLLCKKIMVDQNLYKSIMVRMRNKRSNDMN